MSGGLGWRSGLERSRCAVRQRQPSQGLPVTSQRRLLWHGAASCRRGRRTLARDHQVSKLDNSSSMRLPGHDIPSSCLADPGVTLGLSEAAAWGRSVSAARNNP